MTSNSKTIKVNPIFLMGSGGSLSGSSGKNKTRKEKPLGVSLGQSNNIKKKLIARIKNFQQKGQSATATQPSSEFEKPDAFSDSLNFLDNLARDKEETKREKKNTTLKKKQQPLTDAYMHIATELPPELDWNTIKPAAAVPQTIPQTIPQTMTMPAPMQIPSEMPAIAQWSAPPQPSYGNLKKGNKPTYRTWLRTTQKQKPIVRPTINILEDFGAPIVHEEPLDNELDASPLSATFAPASNASAPNASAALAPSSNDPFPNAPLLPNAPTLLQDPSPIKPYTPSLKPRRKRITRTLKYKLGKHANGTVSVLIKNSQTRRKVQTEQALLKQKSILEIKNHLRSNNLLKVGSNAPSDVLRHLYEQSILAGQIENKAKDTLLHNYFNADK
jgi:hypothetical protein